MKFLFPFTVNLNKNLSVICERSEWGGGVDVQRCGRGVVSYLNLQPIKLLFSVA